VVPETCNLGVETLRNITQNYIYKDDLLMIRKEIIKITNFKKLIKPINRKYRNIIKYFY
jgi:hypothetical protein